MNIAFSNYDDLENPYYGGGGAFAVHEVAKRLVSFGHHVTVFTGKYPKSHNKIVDGVQYKRVGLHIFDARVGQLTFQLCLPWLVHTNNFDVWVESFTPPVSTALLPLFTKKPVVGVTHFLAGKPMRKKYGLPFDFFERLGLQVYTTVIVLQDELKAELLKINHALELYVVPNGVDEKIFQEAPVPKEPYIAFLGRIDLEQKGLDLLLQAYASLEPSQRLPLKIAGTGLPNDMVRLRELVQLHNLADSVELLGKLEGQAKYNFLNAAMVFTMPSRTENFALSLLEASAFGLPIVTFGIPGVAWVPDSCALKVTPFNTQQFAQTLSKVSTDAGLREQLGHEAKNMALRYRWDVIAKQYEEILQKETHNS